MVMMSECLWNISRPTTFLDYEILLKVWSLKYTVFHASLSAFAVYLVQPIFYRWFNVLAKGSQNSEILFFFPPDYTLFICFCKKESKLKTRKSLSLSLDALSIRTQLTAVLESVYTCTDAWYKQIFMLSTPQWLFSVSGTAIWKRYETVFTQFTTIEQFNDVQNTRRSQTFILCRKRLAWLLISL